MVVFHVYVEAPAGAAPEAVRALADAMAQRYGLPSGELQARLARGRFRVKANVDRAKADEYVRDLEAVGARVIVEIAQASQPIPTVKPDAPARPSHSSLPPPNASRTTSRPEVASGLSAAFGDHAVASLGALEATGGALSLASLDGVDAAAPARGATAFAPAASVAAAAFAPPDAADAELKVELAPDELAHRARKSTPPKSEPIPPTPRTSKPSIPAVASAASPRTTKPSIPAADAPAAEARRASGSSPPANAPKLAGATVAAAPFALARPRVRLAAGVVLAIVLGFVPAHLVAAMQERSAYGAIDGKLATAQGAADTDEAYQSLDTARASALAQKASERRAIALTALLVWAAAGGALAYVWFRRVPWDRLG